MSKTKQTEDIYSSAVVQTLEQQYCSSCSAAVVSSALGMGRVVSRIYNGGRQALYTAAVGAMLLNNVAPAYATTTTVPADVTSTGLIANAGDTIEVYGTTQSTTVYEGGEEMVYNGGETVGTTLHISGTQYINDSGVGNATTLLGGTQVVSAGGWALNTVGSSEMVPVTSTVMSTVGGRQEVFGLAESGTFQDYSEQYVYDGGSAFRTTLSDHAKQVVSSGGTATRTYVSNDGAQIVQGQAVRTNIYAGGSQVIQSGGSASLATLVGGSQVISSGGRADSVALHSGEINVALGASATNVTQYSGNINAYVTDDPEHNTYITGTNQYGSSFSLQSGVASNFVLNENGSQVVASGGVANHTIVNSAANQLIGNGGTANSTVINDGGVQTVSGGPANSTVVNQGGVQIVSSGGGAIGTTLHASGTQYINDGGVGNVTTLLGGTQVVSSGGWALNTVGSSEMVPVTSTVMSTVGGRQEVFGLAESGTFQDYAEQYVYDGGSAFQTTFSDHARQTVSSGGTVTRTSVGNEGTQIVQGQAVDTTIYAGGSQLVQSGGNVISTVLSGGIQTIYNAQATQTSISAGASQFVGSGGLATSTFVNGTQTVIGGSALSTIIFANASQEISHGGIATSTTLRAGTQEVGPNASAFATQISSGGSQLVAVLGSATDTVINHNASQVVNGIANNTRVFSGGRQIVGGMGAVATNTTVYVNGTQVVSSGASAVHTVVYGSGIAWNGGTTSLPPVSVTTPYIVPGGGSTSPNAQQIILAGGVADNTIISTYGEQVVSSGGIANNTVIGGGDATQLILSGGVANSTFIYEDGVQNVKGSAYQTEVYTGGIQNVSANATATGTTVNGGTQSVQGVAGDTVLSAGAQRIGWGGVANNTTLQGGTQHILSGATANDNTLVGGMVNLSAGGTLNGLTATGGALQVYGNNTLQGNISLANANVHIQHSGSMNTLTVNDLTADNATFHMNVDLEQQTSDKLDITGSYSGNANLKLTNTAAAAAEITDDSIKLVEFGSGASVDGTFDLVGGQWDEGGYVYKLAQDSGSPDYYLRSTKEFSDTFKTILNIPVMNAVIAQTGMNSLQRRLGDLRAMNNPTAKQGVWVRSYYKDMTVKDLVKTDMNLFGAEAGYDWLFRADEPTKLYAGVLVGFVAANDIKTKNNKGMYDKGDGQAPGVGVYATLINEDGWFVDIAARNFWSKLDMKNHISDGTELAYKPKRNVFAASVELGKSFNSELSRNRFIRIEPKVEVGYMNAAKADTEVGNTLNKINYDAANYINAKAGVLLAYNAIRSNGLLIEPLLELAYRYEFDGKDKVTYGGATAESDLGGGTAEINAGLNMQLTDNLYWYGLGSYEAGNKVKGWGVHAGIRYAFGGNRQAAYQPAQETTYAPKQQATKQQATNTKTNNSKNVYTPAVQQPRNTTVAPVNNTKDYSFMKEMERRWREGK